MEGFVAGVHETLKQVRDLFGTPAPVLSSAGTSSAGQGGTPGWSGAASSDQRVAATALDNKNTHLHGADHALDGFSRTVATDTATSRKGADDVIVSANKTTMALAPYTNTLAGRVALASSLTDHVATAGDLVTGYGNTLPGRQQQLTGIAAQYTPTTPPPGTPPGPGQPGPRPRRRRRRRMGRPPLGRGGGGAPPGGGMGMRPPGGGGMPGGAMGMPNLSQVVRGGLGVRSGPPAGDAAVGGPGRGTPLGSLSRSSSPREVAAAIIHEALRRGYSRQQAIVILADALQESGLRPTASGGGGAWHGIFQQDTSYPGRDDPNRNIAAFFDRLDHHGGPRSPDIAKSIFWLQQRPGEPSAEAAYAHGRQAYLTEFMHQHGRATQLFNDITNA
ncbi:hypothetical protein [Mycolicibacterium llatzerense]|uniref:hypothetical protein n=1 Tax=Mycolicibacterium llatzerense TaxID=280871 RepID=UPI0008DC7DD0|nr:hypothetical protein [Mycolicibacterium llatzerense]